MRPYRTEKHKLILWINRDIRNVYPFVIQPNGHFHLFIRLDGLQNTDTNSLHWIFDSWSYATHNRIAKYWIFGWINLLEIQPDWTHSAMKSICKHSPDKFNLLLKWFIFHLLAGNFIATMESFGVYLHAFYFFANKNYACVYSVIPQINATADNLCMILCNLLSSWYQQTYHFSSHCHHSSHFILHKAS